ncbi:MAG TPA: preprotein translocase subunit YajC [Bdellovibrionota bacterium]|jgi:preprotein translocase subunit YajC|nr:preprotein translocase subunit YajC [Bdellovibrionota bacterium]
MNSRKTFSAGLVLCTVLFLLGLTAMPLTTRADGVPVPAGSPTATQTAPAPAQGATAGQAGTPGQPGALGMLMPFALVFGVMYLFMLRPQQKRMKEHKQLLEALKKGDDVVTSSGFLGKVHGITDKVVTLELSDNVRVKLLKSQVSQIIKGNQISDAVS